MNELFETITLLGVLQGAGLATVLCVRKANHLASRLLGALVGGVAMMLLLGYVGRRWGFHGHPHLIGLGIPLPFLFTPLLYLYVSALTRPLQRLQLRDLVHGLPWLAFVLFMVQAFYLHSGEEKLELIRAHVRGDLHPGMVVFNAVQVTQAVAYLFAAHRELQRHKQRMEGYYSNLSAIDLRWLQIIVLCNAVVWSVVAVQNVAEMLPGYTGWFAALDSVVQVGSALFIFLIGYIFLWQPDLTEKTRAARRFETPLETQEEPEPSTDEAAEATIRTDGSVEPAVISSTVEHTSQQPALPQPTPEQPTQGQPVVGQSALEQSHLQRPPSEQRLPRYQRNRLDDEEASRLAANLQRLMREKEPFRDASLTAQELADELAVSPHTLSQVLNVHIGQTFYAFVNGHRAEALKAALTDPSRAERGVLELALEAGFNSKSTLNSFFKQHTGMTPTRFRQHSTQVR
jgi:AraC-like DNA-binding protein